MNEPFEPDPRDLLSTICALMVLALYALVQVVGVLVYGALC